MWYAAHHPGLLRGGCAAGGDARVHLHRQRGILSPCRPSFAALRASLGSTSLVTTGAGAEVARQLYLPYGAPRWIGGTLPTDFTFTGQRADSDGFDALSGALL